MNGIRELSRKGMVCRRRKREKRRGKKNQLT